MKLNSAIMTAFILAIFFSGCSYQTLAANPPVEKKTKEISIAEKAQLNYLMALKQPNNPAIVESAIFHVVKLKRFYPATQMAEIEKELANLSQNGDTRTIRFKAYIANMFLSNSDLLKQVEKQDYKDGDQFFTLLNTKLQDSLLNMTVE